MRTFRGIGLVAALAVPLWIACGSRAPSDPLQAQAWEYGIEILGVQLTGDGDFARLNYRVVDYEKAKRSFRGDVRLVAQATDRALPVTSTGRLGPLRQRPSSTGRPQFMLFTNSARALKKGDHAALLIGTSRIDGIPVT